MKRTLIEIEGPDFAGKGTVIEGIKKLYPNIASARLPGYSKLGEYLRPVVKTFDMSPRSSLGIALAGMMSTYEEIGKLPNQTVITDRGLTSVLVYQGMIEGALKECPHLFETVYCELYNQIRKNFDNYIRVILDLDVDEIIARKQKRGSETEEDKFDNFDRAGFQKMLDYYHNASLSYGNFYSKIEEEYNLASGDLGGRMIVDTPIVINVKGKTPEEVVKAVRSELNYKFGSSWKGGENE